MKKKLTIVYDDDMEHYSCEGIEPIRLDEKLNEILSSERNEVYNAEVSEGTPTKFIKIECEIPVISSNESSERWAYNDAIYDVMDNLMRKNDYCTFAEDYTLENSKISVKVINK